MFEVHKRNCVLSLTSAPSYGRHNSSDLLWRIVRFLEQYSLTSLRWDLHFFFEPPCPPTFFVIFNADRSDVFIIPPDR